MVEEEPDFIDNGEKLKADAESAQVAKPNPKIRSGTELVMVTEYLERPCAKWPEGRRLVIANNREIFPEERYPVEDARARWSTNLRFTDFPTRSTRPPTRTGVWCSRWSSRCAPTTCR
jgi:hypothetical protein